MTTTTTWRLLIAWATMIPAPDKMPGGGGGGGGVDNDNDNDDNNNWGCLQMWNKLHYPQIREVTHLHPRSIQDAILSKSCLSKPWCLPIAWTMICWLLRSLLSWCRGSLSREGTCNLICWLLTGCGFLSDLNRSASRVLWKELLENLTALEQPTLLDAKGTLAELWLLWSFNRPGFQKGWRGLACCCNTLEILGKFFPAVFLLFSLGSEWSVASPRLLSTAHRRLAQPSRRPWSLGFEVLVGCLLAAPCVGLTPAKPCPWWSLMKWNFFHLLNASSKNCALMRGWKLYRPHQFSFEMNISSHRVFLCLATRGFSTIFLLFYFGIPFLLLYIALKGGRGDHWGAAGLFERLGSVRGMLLELISWWKYHDAKLGPQGWKSFFLADFNSISGECVGSEMRFNVFYSGRLEVWWWKIPYELTEFQYFKATVQQVQSVFFIGMQCLGPQAWDCPGRDHELGVVRGLKVAECQK